MPNVYSSAKLDAWTLFLRTIRIRFAHGCDCTTCRSVRHQFETVYRGAPTSRCAPELSPREQALARARHTLGLREGQA